MNSLIENNYIKEMVHGSNIFYILNDNNSFLSTEYKVLQSHGDSCFVKCVKMLFNGKIQLCYFTEKYRKFSSLIYAINPENFLTICSNLFENIIEVKNNGFLSCQNIDISFERVYIDQSTYNVSLIYLPISKRLFDDTSSFENELRTNLIRVIQMVPSLSNKNTIAFSANLSDGSLSLENLYAYMKSGKIITHISPAPTQPKISEYSKIIKLVALNAPSRTEIRINKKDFVIGKSETSADGVINYNKMISRNHCLITQNGKQYMIVDLNSLNGTFINHVRIPSNKPYPINSGDIIRLANSDFQVVQEEE